MNRAILMGRLGADPELKYTQGGTAICRLRMVTSKVWYNDKKEKQEKSEWHTVVFWGPQGENVSKYFGKGDQILVEGEIETRNWEDNNGNKRNATEIRAHHFEFAAKAQGNQGGGQRQSGGNQQGRGYQGFGRDTQGQDHEDFGGEEFNLITSASIGDDDIPF